jgi:DNA-binding protein Fis
MRRYSISAAIDEVLDNFLLLQKDVTLVSGLYSTVVNEVEKILIIKILKAMRYNKNKTSKILGISRNTLTAKMKVFDIKGS